jgi:hypothetical protein
LPTVLKTGNIALEFGKVCDLPFAGIASAHGEFVLLNRVNRAPLRARKEGQQSPDCKQRNGNADAGVLRNHPTWGENWSISVRHMPRSALDQHGSSFGLMRARRLKGIAREDIKIEVDKLLIEGIPVSLRSMQTELGNCSKGIIQEHLLELRCTRESTQPSNSQYCGKD